MTTDRFHVRRLMVFALLLSLGLGVTGVTVTAAAWGIAYTSGVFTDLQEVVSRSPSYSTFDVYSVLGFRPVIRLAVAVAVAGLVWTPFLAALLGVAYNATVRLLGPTRTRT